MRVNTLKLEIGMEKEVRKLVLCNKLNAVNGENYKTKSTLLNRKCYYMKDAVKTEKLKILHVVTEEMNTDYLTKSFSGLCLLKNVKNLMKVLCQ